MKEKDRKDENILDYIEYVCDNFSKSWNNEQVAAAKKEMLDISGNLSRILNFGAGINSENKNKNGCLSLQLAKFSLFVELNNFSKLSFVNDKMMVY